MSLESEEQIAFQQGINAAKAALINANKPLFFKDEATMNDKQNIEAMGWNSICASTENQLLWKKEHERIKKNREYFETGCLCIRDQKIELKDVTVPDLDAVIYYEQACECTRNYSKNTR